MTNMSRLTESQIEEIASHLSMEPEELEGCATEIADSVGQITGAWAESSLNVDHLSRDERKAFLQRSVDTCRPNLVDGIPVHLYGEVQASKGEPRRSAAIVDLGDVRILFVGG